MICLLFSFAIGIGGSAFQVKGDGAGKDRQEGHPSDDVHRMIVGLKLGHERVGVVRRLLIAFPRLSVNTALPPELHLPVIV